MTRPGRNDLCPCGSGRKYKQCCQAKDVVAEVSGSTLSAVRERMRTAAASEREWQADAIPVMARFEDGKSPRPVLLLVTAGELVVHENVVGRLGGETVDVARAIERTIMATAREAGVFPETVRVRHDDVAAQLGPLLAARDVAVESGAVPALEAAARSLMGAVFGAELWPPVCHADTWAAWDLPRPLIAELFAAAAQFYRLAPWSDVANLQAPRAVLPSGRAWTCSVLGNADIEYGLALYSEPSDLHDVAEHATPAAPFGSIRGRMIGVTFGGRTAEVEGLRREARLNRWELAGPHAIPALMTVNTPGGGVSRQDARDLIALLRALPAFVQKHRRALRTEERTGEPVTPIAWHEPDSGIAFQYAGEAVLYDADDDFDPRDVLASDADFDPSELLRAAIREVAEELGEAPDEAALMEALDRKLRERVFEQNRRPQQDSGGLSPEQVDVLLQADWSDPLGPVRLRRDLSLSDVASSDILADARTLLGLAIERGSLGATQAGNLKVDVVTEMMNRMSDRYERMAGTERAGTRIREEDVWPLHTVRVVCELAGLLHPRSTRFDLTAAGRRLADDAHVGELYELLFRTWFRKFDISYGGRLQWPELQTQFAYTLYRLPDTAKNWRNAAALLQDVVLPHARSRAPVIDTVETAPIILETDVLDTLAGFGLLDRREESATAQRPPAGSLRAAARYRATPLARTFAGFDL